MLLHFLSEPANFPENMYRAPCPGNTPPYGKHNKPAWQGKPQSAAIPVKLDSYGKNNVSKPETGDRVSRHKPWGSIEMPRKSEAEVNKEMPVSCHSRDMETHK
jgi:hypothetical protein